MITQYRPAYYDAPRASDYAGLSTDNKPLDVNNGSSYKEIDTGKIYIFDAQNKLWYEKKDNGGEPEITVRPITIIENGTVTAPGGTAYSPVTVNVPTGLNLKQYTEQGWTDANLSSAEITKVRDYAFANNENVVTANFTGVTDVGAYAFQGCTKLTAFDFAAVKSIGAYAFKGCSALAPDVSLPNCTTLWDRAFTECSSLVSFSAPKVTTIYHSTLATNASLASVSLPLVTVLNDWCLSANPMLKELTLPSVTKMTRYALARGGLEKLVLPGTTLCTIAGDTLQGTPIEKGAGYVYVPDDMVDSYKAAANWSTIANQIKPISELQ